MGKTKKQASPTPFKNPFLNQDREKLWEKLENEAHPIPKSEVVKQAQKLKKESE